MADIGVGISVEEFIRRILKTNVAEAEHWVDSSSKSFPKEVWELYLRQGMTEASLQWFVSAIPIQISVNIRRLHLQGKNYQELLARGEIFLQEILQKAEECGVDISGAEVWRILLPT